MYLYVQSIYYVCFDLNKSLLVLPYPSTPLYYGLGRK